MKFELNQYSKESITDEKRDKLEIFAMKSHNFFNKYLKYDIICYPDSLKELYAKMNELDYSRNIAKPRMISILQSLSFVDILDHGYSDREKK